MKRESNFQADLIREIYERFPGCEVAKMDPEFFQGIPDLLILYGNKWALLECKRSKDATFRPNQEYYIKHFDDMSFSRVIYPENKKEVLDDLQRSFEVGRATCSNRRE